MMRTLPLLAAAAGALLAVPAVAQDAGTAAPAGPDTSAAAPAPASQDSTAPVDQAPPMSASSTGQTGSAPDGSRAFGFVPYFGVMGGWEIFDNVANRSGVPTILNANGTKNTHAHLSGGMVEGVVGFNIPLGPLFAGVEGNVAKGVDGDIDWQYGAAARGGIRAGDSGLFYGKVGYQWVNFDHIQNSAHDYHDWEYGIGFEVGPKDIGLSGLRNRAGLRFRGEVSTFGDFHSFRPMGGIIAHF